MDVTNTEIPVTHVLRKCIEALRERLERGFRGSYAEQRRRIRKQESAIKHLTLAVLDLEAGTKRPE